MQYEDNHNNIEDICTHCIIDSCNKKGTAGHVPNCPKDPTEQEYIEAFRLRYDGKPKQKQ